MGIWGPAGENAAAACQHGHWRRIASPRPWIAPRSNRTAARSNAVSAMPSPRDASDPRRLTATRSLAGELGVADHRPTGLRTSSRRGLPRRRRNTARGARPTCPTAACAMAPAARTNPHPRPLSGPQRLTVPDEPIRLRPRPAPSPPDQLGPEWRRARHLRPPPLGAQARPGMARNCRASRTALPRPTPAHSVTSGSERRWPTISRSGAASGWSDRHDRDDRRRDGSPRRDGAGSGSGPAGRAWSRIRAAGRLQASTGRRRPDARAGR